MKRISANKIKYNEVYEFTFNIAIDGWTDDEIKSLLQDGRVNSHLLEKQIPKWFELDFENQAGYDHIDKFGNKYEQKGFKQSCNLQPSKCVGKGREYSLEAQAEHRTFVKNNKLKYILTDVSAYPTVKLVFKEGLELLNEFPDAVIKKKSKSKIFETNVKE